MRGETDEHIAIPPKMETYRCPQQGTANRFWRQIKSASARGLTDSPRRYQHQDAVPRNPRATSTLLPASENCKSPACDGVMLGVTGVVLDVIQYALTVRLLLSFLNRLSSVWRCGLCCIIRSLSCAKWRSVAFSNQPGRTIRSKILEVICAL